MVLQYFKKKENKEINIANIEYKKILKKSNNFINKNNFFYNKDYKTTFEIISIFLIFYIKMNIMTKKDGFKVVNQEILNIFISDLDESFRTVGIGDMSIGKYVKSYVKKFYYRMKKLEFTNNTVKSEELVNYIELFNFIRKDQIPNASEELLNELK
tara:strand:- start:1838 stop:2305 length:468 start_codon:yes stop_codon:yes gene_type:complete